MRRVLAKAPLGIQYMFHFQTTEAPLRVTPSYVTHLCVSGHEDSPSQAATLHNLLPALQM